MSQQRASGLERNRFAYEASVGVKYPWRQIRGFIDSMLFSLILTPHERRLTWERADGKTIVVEWEPELQPPASHFSSTEDSEHKRTRLRSLVCHQCKRYVDGVNDDVCRVERHIWELTSLELDGRELADDVNARFREIPVSCCSDGHIWHRKGGVRCPKCGLRRRTGKRYTSIRVYVPLGTYEP